jgi:sugar lactone lactonase YvrE
MFPPSLGVQLISLWLLIGCHGTSDPATSEDTTKNTQTMPARTLSIPISGDPNGLWWDSIAQTLFIADDDGNQILKWTDADGLSIAGKLPQASADGPGLGQPVRIADGSLIIPRFGYGTVGDVAILRADGTTQSLSSLDKQRRRIGLALAEDGTLYGAYYLRTGTVRSGGVATLDLSGRETDVITGLRKTVGVLVSDGSLYVSDQELGQIVKAPLSAPQKTTVFATLETPDLLSAGPQGSLYTGGPQGTVRQIHADGSVTVFHGGFQQVRGLAWDALSRRLFVANHDADPIDGIHNSIEIVPVGS